MNKYRIDWLARCRASGVPEEMALEMWQDEITNEAARLIHERIMAQARLAETIGDAE